MVVSPVVTVEAASVEAALMSLTAALSSASLGAWLAGPMTQGLQQRAAERFRAEGSDDGPWEQLAPATLNFRAAQGYPPGPINRRSGEMERYVTQSNSSITHTGDGALLVHPGTPPSGRIRDKVATAQGETYGVPAREVIGLGTADIEFALYSLGTWMATAMRGGGA